MLYELINPSDPYVFNAPNLEIAALTAFIVGEGNYGAVSEDGSEKVPTFILGGSTEWYQETFNRRLEIGLKESEADIAESLSSFTNGNFKDRYRYEAALDAIDSPEERETFIAKWRDGISSMNDIGSRARRLGEFLRSRVAVAARA